MLRSVSGGKLASPSSDCLNKGLHLFHPIFSFTVAFELSKIMFSALVVTYNEERHLKGCLNSLSFCEQLLVIDLGSTDSSLEISKNAGAEIIYHKPVPVVEVVRKEAILYAKHDWVIFLDPDEIFPSHVADKLRSMILRDSHLGAIQLPWQFYMKGKPLKYTIWGKEKKKVAVLNKHRNEFLSDIHAGAKVIDGYHLSSLPVACDAVIKHYWMDSYKQLFRKHIRYLKAEGETRYRRGETFLWNKFIINTAAALKLNLLDYNGLHGGLRGIFLSFFYAWYVAMSMLSLYRYQRSIRDFPENF